MKKLFLCVVFGLLMAGCEQGETFKDRSAEIAASKKVMANREKFAKEIIQATNDCIKNANSLTHLTASGNDSEEVVKACAESAQKAYGAYSPYFESYLQEWASQ